MVELTAERIRTKADEYDAVEPLAAVEDEHVEMLPGTFSGDEYGKRDVEWVVQWYYRRYLGSYSDRDRREREGTFRENDFGEVIETLRVVDDLEDPAAKLRELTTLSGVDVPIASAFLQFMSPDEYVVVGDREWAVLAAAGELDGSYPDPPTIEEYLTYLAACRRVTDRCGCGGWTLYKSIWRIWKTELADRQP